MDALGNDQPDYPRNAPPSANEIALKAGEQENDHENEIEDGDEDEDEDLDFNPFLKGMLSPEASSSLSSEVDGLEGGNLSNAAVEVQDYAVGDSEYGEEVVMQTAISSENGKRLKKPVHRKSKKRKSDAPSQMVNENAQLKDIGSNMPIINVGKEENDDAIWKRTRARYSLASFTLDELETFLQETDDEEDLQNVDDEEEYRKFLAAVLQGGDGNDLSPQDNGNADDEDEDNDADFELELEELLESDGDDAMRDNEKREYEKAGRRPETRQNRRRKVSAQYNKKLLEQSKRPLRPLLPIFPNGGVASFSMIDRKTVTPDNAPSQLCSAAEDGLINGFTPQQIGQLHCLIHEHVQLLIQVYSLCILDSSRQQVASQVQGLISEMLCKRDEVMASRRMPFPANCFHPLYMFPSVVDELPHFSPAQHTFGSSSSVNTRMSVSQNTFPSEGRETAFNRRIDSSRTSSSLWLPCIRGPVVSILDVAPLNFAGRYIEDVHNAVREYRRGHLDSNCETRYAREPLFHHPYLQSMADANGEVLRRNMNIPDTPNAAPFVPSQKPFKKTLAASIVERAKKQPVALVPKDISKLAQSFLPLFNPALFPHKPPPASVANRILFTDAEDELLALGMMEYNTNWKAIQQRFLPCKSKHQIFVRQKNRCSSKAPDNPIKAVRKMKTSPLTAEEIEGIQEGLNVFKLDWMSVWKHVVPHRDPSLLRRQWRIALGTQRSYKQDAAKKEKRRLYESNRRKKKTRDLADWETSSGKEDNQVDSAGGENNSGDDYVDNANEAYVHQAFLSDWRPGTSTLFSSNLRGTNLSSVTLSREGFNIREQPNDSGHAEAQPQTNSIHGFPYPSHCYQFPHSMTLNCPSSSSEPTLQISDVTLNSSKSNACLGPSRTCGTDGTQLVRLAPQLPPVNLPPSVRVISQSAFKNSRCGVSLKVSTSGGNTGDAGKESAVRQPPHALDSRTMDSINTRRNESDQEITNVSNSCPEEFTNSRPEGSPLVNDACAVGEKGGDLDLQMHPLLFRAPEDGCLPYYSLSCSNETSSSLSFFSGKQPQLNLSLFHNPHQANHVVGGFSKSSKTKESCSASCGIDFHPLLQRAEEENGDLATACLDTRHIASSGGKAAFQNSFGSSQISNGCQSSSANEKGNELDLEIHLSNTSVKEKAGGSEDVNAKNMSISAVKVPNSGNKVETQKFSSPCHQQSENLPAVPSSFVSAANGSTVPSTNVSACNMDDTGDQSHPGIVMEQEELSDSDDEIEEHVEFECEEMADSDGEEGSGCEATAQEVPSSLAERVIAGTDDSGKICESRSAVCPQSNPSSPKKDGPLFLKLSLGKEPNSGSWLSLDSCAPFDSSGLKGKTAVEGGTAKAAGRPNRSTKKTTPRTKKMRKLKDVTDMAQQLSLGPLSVSTLKKPRKRTSRTNTNLSIGMIP